MTRIVVVSCVLAAIAACGGTAAKPIANTGTGSAAQADTIGDEAFAKYTLWTKQMCACAAGDQACASAIVDAQVRWSEDLAKAGDRGRKADPKEAERMAARLQPLMAELTMCLMKAMNPPVPPATP
jgi:hypothetical protein